MPLPLVVSLAYIPCHLIARRRKPPFAEKGGNAYVFLRMTVVLLALPLFLIGGVAPPLTMLSLLFSGHDLLTPVALAEMALLPFTVGAIIHGGLRLAFRLAHGNMRNYLDYGVITYYVSTVILAAYGFVILAAVSR